MIGMLQRAERLARAEQARAIRRIGAELRSRLVGATVEDGDSQVEIRGRRLLKRWLGDPALRFVAGAMR